MSSCLMCYSVLYELNTLDACWIVVDMWSNSSRCRIVSVYLTRTLCLYFIIIALDIVITLCFSINCSAVICSPTVLFAILREATSETYGPGSILRHISFPSTSYFWHCLFCNLYIPIYIIKIPKLFILLLLSLSDLTLVSDRDTTPLSRWLRGSYLFVQVRGICM